jgi:hypothetical protein
MWSEVDVFGHIRTSVSAFVIYTIVLSTVNCLQIFFDAQVDKYQRVALGKKSKPLSITLAGSYFMYDLIDAVITYAIANGNLRSIGIMLVVEAIFVFVLYYKILEGDPCKKKRSRFMTRALYDRGGTCALIDAVNDMTDAEREILIQTLTRPCAPSGKSVTVRLH